MSTLSEIARVSFIGVGATAVMDLWLLSLARLGVRAADFTLVGRWVGHLAHGRVVHESISMSEPVPHELRLGWATHYGVGVAYAGLLVALEGVDWVRSPTPLPALAIGLATVVVPLLVMQPAMGLGWAGTRMGAPLKSGIRSLANHAVFGFGLFLAAAALQRLLQGT